jgi:hypothetical protein
MFFSRSSIKQTIMQYLIQDWVRESNITFCPFANAVGNNQEHPKNHGNGNGNKYYHYHVPLLLIFHLFMVELAIEKQKYRL